MKQPKKQTRKTAKAKARSPKAAAPTPAKRAGGRPPSLEPDPKTLALIESAGEIQCTQSELAALLRVSETTLVAFFRKHPDARQTYDWARESGKESLRRVQFKTATEGKTPNVTMQIWLGKQWLKQSDKQELTGAGGRPLFDLTGLSDKDLEDLARLRDKLDATLSGGDRRGDRAA